MFDDVKNTRSLNFLMGDSPEDLLRQIQAITFPVIIVSIYAVGSKHCAWIKSDATIKRVPKKAKAVEGV